VTEQEARAAVGEPKRTSFSVRFDGSSVIESEEDQ